MRLAIINLTIQKTSKIIQKTAKKCSIFLFAVDRFKNKL